MVPMAGLAAVICVGIAVDFSGQVHAEQQLRDTAGFCAREGSQVITVSARSTNQAIEQADSCLNRHHISGVVTVEGTTLAIEVRGDYTTQILSIISVDTLETRARVSTEILSTR
jgi:hypothetical protein